MKIKIKDVEYYMKSELNEITIGEFEIISNIMTNNEKMEFEKWTEIFVFLGIPQDIVDEFDTSDFIEIIQKFNATKHNENTSIEKNIDINGTTYTSYDDDFKLIVKDAKLIENYIKKNSEYYFGELMAVIYKDKSLDKSISYDETHIEYKAKLFRENVTADKITPILSQLTKKLVKEYNLLNATT